MKETDLLTGNYIQLTKFNMFFFFFFLTPKKVQRLSNVTFSEISLLGTKGRFECRQTSGEQLHWEELGQRTSQRLGSQHHLSSCKFHRDPSTQLSSVEALYLKFV